MEPSDSRLATAASISLFTHREPAAFSDHSRSTVSIKPKASLTFAHDGVAGFDLPVVEPDVSSHEAELRS